MKSRIALQVSSIAAIVNPFLNFLVSPARRAATFDCGLRQIALLLAVAALSQGLVHAECVPPTTGGVHVCNPATGKSSVNPIHYVAAASSKACAAGISTMSIFSSPGVLIYSVQGSTIDSFVPLPLGTYNSIVEETDKCGGRQQTNVGVTVTGMAVITYQYNVQRTGANLYETLLTLSNVNSAAFGKIFSCRVDSFIYGQPLFVPKMNIGGATHNVLFGATENNSIYAFDADGKSCTPLWHTSIGLPVPCTTNSPVPGSNCSLVFKTPGLGITSTMFIDPAQGSHGVIYAEGRTAGAGQFFHGLHKFDLATGKEMPDGPSVISASIAGNSCDSVNGVVGFNSAAQNGRSALLYANGVIYVAFGSINDAPVCPSVAYHGWILGYNAFNIKQQVSVFNTSRNKSTNDSGLGGLGGIWGGALAASTNNLIFAATGNGPFDASVGDWGSSYLELQPSGGQAGELFLFRPVHSSTNSSEAAKPEPYTWSIEMGWANSTAPRTT